jgi:hypothetical protein
MRSILGACLECIFAIDAVWPNTTNEDSGLARQIAELGIIKVADFDGYIRS